MTVSSRCLPLFLAGSALLAQVPPPPPPAPPAPPAPMIGVDLPSGSRTEQRTEKLAYGSKLWVKNRNGGILVSGWDKDEVALTAEIRDSDQRRIDLAWQRWAGPGHLRPLPAARLTLPGAATSPWCGMTLHVPRRLLGHFRTTNGEIRVETVVGYVRCETVNGDITVRSRRRSPGRDQQRQPGSP